MSSEWNAIFSSNEREYVNRLKRKDRDDLLEKFQRSSQGCNTDPPMRIQILQREYLPIDLRMRIFTDLRNGACEKQLQWVRKLLRIPLGTYCAPRLSPDHVKQAVADARRAMNDCMTGYTEAKAEVAKMACRHVLSRGRASASYALAIEGPPGTGKTRFVRKALGRALERPLISIPLGGATDVSYLLGSLYTYEGSKEGRLVAALVEAGCANPILHFDEVDKVSATDRGQEIINTLIHLIDPSANTNMRDRYFHDLDLDFSKCTFVFTFNDASLVSPVLLDRMKRIRVEAPTLTERSAIVRKHLMPIAQSRAHTDLAASDGLINALVTRRASGGMRGVDRDLEHALSEAQMDLIERGRDVSTAIDAHGMVTRAFGLRAVESLSTSRVDCPPPPPPGMFS